MMKSYVKGALSFVLPSARNSHADIFPVSAEFSYSQFLRHLVLRDACKPYAAGESVAELGPGSSIGFGLAALICGADHYQTFDVRAHFDVETNLRVFDRLCALFRARAPIPDEGEFVRLFPFVDDCAFPAVLTPARMAQALGDDRLARIRRDVEAGGGETIRINIGTPGAEPRDEPGNEPGVAPARPVDWLASHSVLEHVEGVDDIYAMMATILAPDGVMTHLIDFSSHGLTKAWNGHWAMPPLMWKVLRGKRTYLINRRPLADHVRRLEAHGIRSVHRRLHRRVDGHLVDAFAPEFSGISARDASTHMAFLVCERGAGPTPAVA